MAQTSIAREASPRWEVLLEAFGHAARYWRHFKVGATFALRPGRAQYYKDADRSHFASRVGEAMGTLFAKESLGYNSVLHLEVARRQLDAGKASAKGKKADFVLLNQDSVALADMKGSFDHANRPDKLHNAIKKALQQTAASVTRLPVPVARQYGILTVLRESNRNDRSKIMWADPAEDVEDDEKKRDAMILGSTSRLLALSGFDGLARSLKPSVAYEHESWDEDPEPEEPSLVKRLDVEGTPFLIAVPEALVDPTMALPVQIGVREELVTAARSRNVAEVLRLAQEPSPSDVGEGSAERYLRFRDGTIAVVKALVDEAAEPVRGSS